MKSQCGVICVCVCVCVCVSVCMCERERERERDQRNLPATLRIAPLQLYEHTSALCRFSILRNSKSLFHRHILDYPSRADRDYSLA